MNFKKSVYTKNSEAEHFDRMVSGASKEVLFYDTEFVSQLTKDILFFAMSQLGDVQDKKLLFYGSGVNVGPAVGFARNGADVVMIDISPKSVDFLNRFIMDKGLERNISARVMDCEEMDFEDGSFDCVFGRAILHHLNVEKSIAEVKRVLKDGGRAVFMEPLGMNPFINLFRYFTPSRRTPDEKPFSKQELELIKQAGFSNFEHYEFSFATNMGIFFEAVLKWKFFRYQTLKKADDFLLNRLSFLRRFCWNTVLVFDR